MRQATYQSTSTSDGVSVLRFDYTVASDSDHDGISIDADSVVLNGATVRHAAGWDAVTTHDALDPHPHQAVSDIALPSLSTTGVTVDEGAGQATFTVTLSSESADTVKVDYATMGGSAAEGGGSAAVYDFQPSSGTLTFDATETTKTVEVVISDDDIDEFDESFELLLSGSSNALIGTISATATITDNDAEAVVSVTGPVSVDEDESEARFTVTLTGKTAKEVEVDYTTTDVSATSGADYEPLSGSLLFEVGGATSKTLDVTILDDEFDELEESFRLDLSSAANAAIDSSSGSATASIADDDPYPELSVEGGTATEGVQVVFTVSLFPLSTETVEVDVATSDDTAVASADYRAVSRRLSFAPGEASKTVGVATVADALDEAEETLQLGLTNAQGATISVDSATGRIDDDDDPPVVAAVAARAAEGESITFTVSLSTASGRTASVAYATSDGSATDGLDYWAESGTLVFAPGERVKTVDVAIIDDGIDEAEESFELLLSDAVNASIGTGRAVGTIDGHRRPVRPVRPVGPVGPTGPGGGDPEPDEPTGPAPNPYTDLVDGSVHQGAVMALVEMGAVEGTGCSSDRFCPNEPILRWMMAVWMVRVVDGGDPDAPSAVRFDDVDPDAWWTGHVERLAELGITNGCAVEPPARFCGDEPVTRGQMAAFLTRAFQLAPAATAGFGDTAGSVHSADIDSLFAAGSTVGCNRDTLLFCPRRHTTKAEMATFLLRAIEDRAA